MARHFCRNRLFRSTSNLLIFFGGLIFGMCVQYLLKDSGDWFVVNQHVNFVEQTGNKMKTVVVDTVVQKVRNDSSHTVADATNVGILTYKSRNSSLACGSYVYAVAFQDTTYNPTNLGTSKT